MIFSYIKRLIYSQVIYIAWIGHLLNVDPKWPVIACVKLDYAMFNHVLQVGKASPDVPLVLNGVCSGAGVPVPERKHIYIYSHIIKMAGWSYWLKCGHQVTQYKQLIYHFFVVRNNPNLSLHSEYCNNKTS